MIVTNYWNCAWRSLTKKKGFSVVNIVGLAIGMAAALLILTYVAFEYSYDDMHSRQDRIFRVEARFYENGDICPFSYPNNSLSNNCSGILPRSILIKTWLQRGE